MNTILVVDDEELLRSTIKVGLQREGFKVLEAADGEAGLELVRREHPALVVCDVYMPKMSGTELLIAVRNDPSVAATLFILMTGDTELTPMRQGMRLGADDYLAKPFLLQELLDAVKSRIAKHEQALVQVEAKVAELRTRLSTSLPHEFLTPLVGILGYAEIIQANYDMLQPTEVLEMVGGIHKSARRLHRLIQNYLLYAQIEFFLRDPKAAKSFCSGKTASSREVITTEAQSRAQSSGRTNDLVLKLGECSVAISEDLFQKIVAELVSNAFNFSQAGSPVLITTSLTATDFCLNIEDGGRGMTAEQIAEIGAYQQFDRQRQEQQGLGLGLAIVKRLTEMHGGTFAVRSEIGIGTTVQITLTAAN